MPTQIIPKLEQLNDQLFLTDYFYPRKPVIIQNMFDGQKLSTVRTLSQAYNVFSNTGLESLDDYIVKAIDEETFVTKGRLRTLTECIKHIDANKQVKLCLRCPGIDSNALFTLPQHVYARPDSEITAAFFLANDKDITHLHFDNDYRSVLIHQVFGKKRIILIPETQSRKLCSVLNQSWINLESFTEEEKTSFIEFSNGYDCVLQPGEALFIPMMMWHHVEYIDRSMSLNIRFGRSEQNTFLNRYAHCDMYMQNIATRFNEFDTSPYEKYYALIKRNLEVMPDTNVKKYKFMRGLLKEIYTELCDDALQRDYYVMENNQIIDANPRLLRSASQPYAFQNWARIFGLEKVVARELQKYTQSSKYKKKG